MRLLFCTILPYLFAVASASSVPTPPIATHSVSATITPTPVPTAFPTSSIQYRTVTSYSTRAAYSDLQRHAAPDSDSPVFRKRLYSDRLTISANYANAREITVSFLQSAARQVGKYLLTLDYGTIGNIVFRAAVRSLTPGYQLQLLDAGTCKQITFDVATSAYMKESYPRLPASPSAENTDVLDIHLPTQLPSLTDLRWGIKYTLAHTDASALISLGLRAAVSYFDLDTTIDTADAMALIDIGMHIVFRSHVTPFHRFGDVLRSLDAVVPSLELSSLVSGLPHPPLLPFKTAEQDSPPTSRHPIRFARPPQTSETNEEPTVVTVYFSESPACTLKAQSHGEQRNADRRSEDLGGYVISENSSDTIIRDVLHIVIAILASGGVVISAMRMIEGFRKAEQAKQDFIKLHALKSLAYLPWERRMELLKTLTAIQPSRMTNLAPNYDIAITSDRSEAQIVAHVTRLVCALSPERRRDLVHVLAIASLPSSLPSLSIPPDSVDPTTALSTSTPSPVDGTTATNSVDSPPLPWPSQEEDP
ncbi:hypothetical protein J132_10437 [Termitomyces sp. J132]|nr:hypothetical protein H2248_006736 [Termitomyces sp. 'cryptogamus']KAH0588005.1 hypothetical protein H2248_006745 [Termitomyces sp. 'cryptogamus']KNZ76462.1 hypothetical protein J132_10437 [Termitomyces sp. J132]